MSTPRPDPLEIGAGCTLGCADVADVARRFRPVSFPREGAGWRRMVLSRAIVDDLVRRQVKIYGLTTGFASLRDRTIAREDTAKLSRNLIRSHSAGMGDPFAEDQVRAAMLLRAHALAQGNSGARPQLVALLVAFLNAGVYPWVPQQGSVGSSGDLAPLSHLFLTLIADPAARVHPRIGPPAAEPGDDPFRRHAAARKSDTAYVASPRTTEFVPIGEVREELDAALRPWLGDEGIWPYVLGAKEGLAANNGAVFCAGALTLAAHDARRLIASAEMACALSFEALQAVPDCLSPEITRLRPHPGHARSAERIREALRGSDLVRAEGAAGLNTAHYNQAMLGLRSVIGPLPDGSKDAEALGKLHALMEKAQAGLRERIEEERAKLRKSAESGSPIAPKVLELRASEAALAPVRTEWERLLGWSKGGDSPLSATRRADLGTIFVEHVAKVVRDPSNPDVQDNYSFRAAATVLGAARDGLDYVRRIAETEINASTDNPLLCLDTVLGAMGAGGSLPDPERLERWLEDHWPVAAQATKSAANFHGEPSGAAADHLGALVCEVGNIAERRVAALTDRHHSKGLPSHLVWSPGLHSGAMMTQYVAASLLSEAKILTGPATVDSIPTGEMSEDHVAMATTATRHCTRVIEIVERIVAIEAFTAYQAVQFRKPAALGEGTRRLEDVLAGAMEELLPDPGGKNLEESRAFLRSLGLGEAAVRAVRPCITEDVVLYPVLEAVADLLRRGKLA